MPRTPIEVGRVNLYMHIVIGDLEGFNLCELEHVGGGDDAASVFAMTVA